MPVSVSEDHHPPPTTSYPPSVKRAPDGNGVRLWKNRVDRIQDPVKGLTLTRRILASGLPLPLHPILPLSLSLSSLPSDIFLRADTGKNSRLVIYLSTHYGFPSHISPAEDFPEEEIPKTALIWSLLCPQVLRNCLTGLLLRLHNSLHIQLEVEEWFTLFLSPVYFIPDVIVCRNDLHSMRCGISLGGAL